MGQTTLDKQAANKTFPPSIIIIAVLMIVFGLAEVVTGFTHQFFGLTTAQIGIATYVGVTLGLFYLVGGILVLTRKKGLAIMTIGLLCGDVLGRVAMVIFGLYPINSFRQSFGIIVGTAIAAGFAVYIGSKLKSFR